MATQKAYGSITIVDIGDLGTLSVYPEADSPNSVIYDPNQDGNNQYNPNWEVDALELSAKAYYGGKELTLSEDKFSITWYKRLGKEDLIEIGKIQNSVRTYSTARQTFETIDFNTGNLSIKKNVLTLSTPTISYVCKVIYTEPQSNIDLTAQGQLSFSIIAQPTTIKSCTITGESAFLYNGIGQLVGAEQITLKGNLQNCSVQEWLYKNRIDSNGNYKWTPVSEDFIDKTDRSKLTIDVKTHDSTTSNYFFDDVAVFKLQTNVANIYDVHTITKIRQGAPGTEILSVVLTNEDMYVPCNADGSLTDGALTNASTEVIVYNGNDVVTMDSTKVSITIDKTSNISGDWDAQVTDKKVYKITGMTKDGGDTGRVIFKVTYTEQEGVPPKESFKVFYLTKIKKGADGTSPLIYSLGVSTVTTTKTADNESSNGYVYTPNNFTVTSTVHDGNRTSAYAGKFRITPYISNVASNTPYFSMNNESEYTYGIGSLGVTTSRYTSFLVELLPAGSSNTTTASVLDRQTITVVSDGETGATGEDGIAIDMGNSADVIPCAPGGEVLAEQIINIPITVYKGIEKIAATIDIASGVASDSQEGPTKTDITSPSKSNDYKGMVQLTFAKGSKLGGRDRGEVIITITIDNNLTISKSYSWSKGRQGESSILLRAYAKTGNIINNGDNSVTLSGELTSGATSLTPTSWQWSKYDFTEQDYVVISGATSKDLTVSPNEVQSYASYKLTAVYSGNSYVDYITVQDKTDPLQVEIFSTLGDKITNGVGAGCVYARVFQNGEELDQLQNLKVSKDDPKENVQRNDIWVHINTAEEKVEIKKCIGFGVGNVPTWQVVSSPGFTCTYTWTFAKAEGEQTTLGKDGPEESNAKFLFVNGARINKKMQFNLEVTKN